MHLSSSIVYLLIVFCFNCLALTQNELARLVLQRQSTFERTPYHYINEKRIGSIAGEPIYPQVKIRLPPNKVAISNGFVPAYNIRYSGRSEQNAAAPLRSKLLETLSERIPAK